MWYVRLEDQCPHTGCCSGLCCASSALDITNRGSAANELTFPLHSKYICPCVHCLITPPIHYCISVLWVMCGLDTPENASDLLNHAAVPRYCFPFLGAHFSHQNMVVTACQPAGRSVKSRVALQATGMSTGRVAFLDSFVSLVLIST